MDTQRRALQELEQNIAAQENRVWAKARKHKTDTLRTENEREVSIEELQRKSEQLARREAAVKKVQEVGRAWCTRVSRSTGEPYYYNSVTEEATFRTPEKGTTVESKSQPCGCGCECHAGCGRPAALVAAAKVPAARRKNISNTQFVVLSGWLLDVIEKTKIPEEALEAALCLVRYILNVWTDLQITQLQCLGLVCLGTVAPGRIGENTEVDLCTGAFTVADFRYMRRCITPLFCFMAGKISHERGKPAQAHDRPPQLDISPTRLTFQCAQRVCAPSAVPTKLSPCRAQVRERSMGSS